MSVKQKFAKATLKAWDKASYSYGKLLFDSFILSSLSTVAVGLPIGAVMTIEDGGAENEAIVVQEYEDALEKITQAKQKFAKKYDISEAENQTNIAYITKSFQKLNTPNNPEKQADWDKIMTMAKIFAKDVQRDPNLSEGDAGDIIEKFEQNVINLKHIGYKDTPDIYDLRECQTIFDDSFDINACTIDRNPISDSEFKKGIFWGAVLPLILFTMPTIFLNIVVPRNKGKLEMLARGKKPPRKNPRISVH